MKLGTDTGSLTNYLLSGTNGQPKPVVGMGATILSWTDRHPATIVEVSKDYKVIAIQRDNFARIDESKTVQENMFDAKIYIIHDSGNLKFSN